MVPHSGASMGAGDLHRRVEQRPLREPARVEVWADDRGDPLAVQRRVWPAPRRVERIQERWRIDDEWWREYPIARLYYDVLVGGMLMTIYRDVIANTWFEQRY